MISFEAELFAHLFVRLGRSIHSFIHLSIAIFSMRSVQQQQFSSPGRNPALSRRVRCGLVQGASIAVPRDGGFARLNSRRPHEHNAATAHRQRVEERRDARARVSRDPAERSSLTRG